MDTVMSFARFSNIMRLLHIEPVDRLNQLFSEPHSLSKENATHGVTANLADDISAMQTFKSYLPYIIQTYFDTKIA